MSSRRTFIRSAGILAGTAAVGSFIPGAIAKDLEAFKIKNPMATPKEFASDEDFWSWVKESYTTSSTLMNLNNGGVSPQPKMVQDMHERYMAMCNEAPSYYMWRILDQGRETLRSKLAELAGVSNEEIAINRNATEALNTVIFGLNLKEGDEIVMTHQDYPNMTNAWKQRELRDKIKVNFIDLDLPHDDDDTIVKKFTEKFNSHTKVVHITHIINWNGQILPVKRIAQKAHEKGIEVLVDGAHSFAHFDFKIPDLDCDYFGTSLHKWLCAPFGCGMLYIKKDKIKNVWPLLSNDKPQSEDIKKFESLGTRSFPAEMSISGAVDFHQAIGSKRKEERLRYLKNYWTSRVKDVPGVKIHTPLEDSRSCAIASITVDGMTAGDLESALLTKYKIHTSPINWADFHFVRITPHVYTTPRDMDRLVMAIKEIAADAIKNPPKDKTKG